MRVVVETGAEGQLEVIAESAALRVRVERRAGESVAEVFERAYGVASLEPRQAVGFLQRLRSASARIAAGQSLKGDEAYEGMTDLALPAPPPKLPASAEALHIAGSLFPDDD